MLRRYGLGVVEVLPATLPKEAAAVVVGIVAVVIVDAAGRGYHRRRWPTSGGSRIRRWHDGHARHSQVQLWPWASLEFGGANRGLNGLFFRRRNDGSNEVTGG